MPRAPPARGGRRGRRARGRSQRRRSAGVGRAEDQRGKDAPSRAGMSHGTRTGLSLGGRTRRPMLTMRTTTSATAGSHVTRRYHYRLPPRARRASDDRSLGAATVRSCARPRRLHPRPGRARTLPADPAHGLVICPDAGGSRSPRPSGRVATRCKSKSTSIWYLEPQPGNLVDPRRVEARGRRVGELVATPVTWDSIMPATGGSSWGSSSAGESRADGGGAARACSRRRNLDLAEMEPRPT